MNALSIDGELPTAVSIHLNFLQLSTIILNFLVSQDEEHYLHKTTLHLWHSRVSVAHHRLLQFPAGEHSTTLWEVVNASFGKTVPMFCDSKTSNFADRQLSSLVNLEYGLAHYYFEKLKGSKPLFAKSKSLSGLQVELTGREGKKTKFQQKSISQMVLIASSEKENPDDEVELIKSNDHDNNDNNDNNNNNKPLSQEHPDEHNPLHEVTQFDDEAYNNQPLLSPLDLSIVLALCLDVKNSNPSDGLTATEMIPYLERVLIQHVDWTIYSTALLERAWLECERSNTRERSILQIQALVDQHTTRLTLTQSTYQSVNDSAKVQDRIKWLHAIVYPPRWSIKADLALRYAKIGVTSTAAELFAELEMWDEVVECYQHSGDNTKAEALVRERLAVFEVSERSER